MEAPVNTYPELTPEEKARRAKIVEVRKELKELAAKRRLILEIYRTPHDTPEFLAAMKQARATLGIPEDYQARWAPHAIPGRLWWRAETHTAHIKLAQLTGKPHVVEQLQPA
jgi:hypothetical protein